MESTGSNYMKSIVSSTRIMFALLPGLGVLILIRLAIHIYRPDMEDAHNRIKPADNLYDCYDFIIVGGGSAGAVLANRLTENHQWNILLLEAGADENVLSEIPVLFPVLQTSEIDWQFVTEPSNSYCLSMVGKQCKWPRGKVLGGSSVLNAMLYIRGNKRDYDNWEAMGNPGWSYEDVLPYFLKSEDMRIPDYQYDYYHSTGGLLTIENFRYEQPITQKILEAGQQLGYNLVDVNGAKQTGFTRSHATVRDGLRCSTAKAFLRPASKRTNLHVSIHSLVEKILIDEHRRAYGVQFKRHGKTYIIKAGREVILSAGAIQSPQLLMLSGIGDAEELKQVGIYPIVHSPGVGKNLQDHVAMGGHSFIFDNPYNNGTDYCFNLNSVFSLGPLIDFTVHKTGLLYSMMEAEAMAFINTKYQDPDEDYPDIQLFIAPTADNMDGGLFGKRANGLTDETYAVLYEDILFNSSFSIVPLLLRPKSRGFIKLKDASPYSPPKIYPNYYSERDDVVRIIEGARIVQELVNQPALQALNARPNPNRNIGCTEHDLMSEEHLECQARHHSLTIYHPVGTCAMGPASDQNAVVDPRLRVYGVRNLRVVDGSVMPTIVNGNTNAPIIMIAEKASDMIKEDWLYSEKESLCPTTYNFQYKTNDEPSKIQLPIHLDVFNETASLFTQLNTDPELKSLLNKPKDNNKIDNSLSVIPRGYDNNIEQNIGVRILPKNPYSPPFRNTKTHYPALYDFYKTPKYFNQLPYVYKSFQKNNNINQDIKKTKPTKFNSLPKYNKQTYPSGHLFINKLKNKLTKPIQNYNEPVYYETKEFIKPTGEKSCKIWLHYNGVKYEVLL